MALNHRWRAGATGDTLSLSFLDVLSCGMGAMIFLFLLLGTLTRQGQGSGVDSHSMKAGANVGAERLESGEGAALGPLAGRLIEVEIAYTGGGPFIEHGCWAPPPCIPGAAEKRDPADRFSYIVESPDTDEVRQILVLPEGVRRRQGEVVFTWPRDAAPKPFRVRITCGSRVWPETQPNQPTWMEYGASVESPAWRMTWDRYVMPGQEGYHGRICE